MHKGEGALSERSRTPPVSTFVVRFWREWSTATGRWRGRIEHVQSGRSADFLDLEAVLDFVRAHGVTDDPPGGREIDRESE